MGLDFLKINVISKKSGSVEVKPTFKVGKSKDLMIKGSDFYAIFDEESGEWKTDEDEFIRLADKELREFYNTNREQFGNQSISVLYFEDSESGSIDRFHKYCQHQCRDYWHNLDETIIFSNTKPKRENYCSHTAGYPLVACDIPMWTELIGTLYEKDGVHKLEWAIGAIVEGDSKDIQKFIVMYGPPGSGKSTILNIVQKLFKGYYCVFDARALASKTDSFALEAFKNNPLVAIQHDGDLSKIEDNTRINSIVSHEEMTVNEKFKSTYVNRFNSFLFMGTNKPVKITDGKSGILRRLIDVSPSGKTVPQDRYNYIMKHIDKELGGIAHHCQQVYLANKNAYDDYVPVSMMYSTNVFYNFVLKNYDYFLEHNGVRKSVAWRMYKEYCEDSNSFLAPEIIFGEELKNYFEKFYTRAPEEIDPTRPRDYYHGFLKGKFELTEVQIDDPELAGDGDISEESTEDTEELVEPWIELTDHTHSIVDDILANCPAQYANQKENPRMAWDDVTTILSELDTSILHWVRVPDIHIVIDFDLKGKDGKKNLALNIEAANKWPKTYCEVSKGGQGLHLHYIYTSGDVSMLEQIYDEGIEVKVYTGKQALRRKLTKCNDIPVAELPFVLEQKKEVKKTFNPDFIRTDQWIHEQIECHLRKEKMHYTAPSFNMIVKILQEAYASGVHYDCRGLERRVTGFAYSSHNSADKCIRQLKDIPWCSKDVLEEVQREITEEMRHDFSVKPRVFFDVEVYPNLFIICWKLEGAEHPVVRMINPTADEVEDFVNASRLVGFNNRDYDNHILYGRMQGYDNYKLYQLSQGIINAKKGEFSVKFREAFGISETDIYDFSSKKQSLKKWEIELKIHHQEMSIPWDQPVPEEMWDQVADYCCNDVIATEAVWNKCQGDFLAREILAALADSTVNDKTNTLTTRIIFGNDRRPKLVYTDLATGKKYESGEQFDPREEARNDDKTIVDEFNAFEGYTYEYVPESKRYCNLYRGIDVGKGGYVYANPGMYGRALTLDIASMHPSSIIAMNCFGEYTKNFQDILNARIAIKHGDFDTARTMLDGKLAPYLDDPKQAKMLAQALKIAINSVYGLTSAAFENPFRDIRNSNNIVALRGALFMKTLQDEVESRGYTVIHIKTDSIKIANPDEEIINFICEFGKKYGYNFEVENIFEKICLVNNAVYIAKLAEDDPEEPGEWHATGAQFAEPYIFKKLFTKQDIDFDDTCQTKTVKSALYLDFDEDLPDGEHDYQFVGRAGQFVPVKSGAGGGNLVRTQENKETGDISYNSVTGCKGYRWMDAETLRENPNRMDLVDMQYYNDIVSDAIETISEYGDFYSFSENASDDILYCA